MRRFSPPAIQGMDNAYQPFSPTFARIEEWAHPAMPNKIRQTTHREQSAIGIVRRRQRGREKKCFGERDFSKHCDLQKATILGEQNILSMFLPVRNYGGAALQISEIQCAGPRTPTHRGRRQWQDLATFSQTPKHIGHRVSLGRGLQSVEAQKTTRDCQKRYRRSAQMRLCCYTRGDSPGRDAETPMPMPGGATQTSSDSSPDRANKNCERLRGPLGRGEAYPPPTISPRRFVRFWCRTGAAMADTFHCLFAAQGRLVLRAAFDGTI